MIDRRSLLVAVALGAVVTGCGDRPRAAAPPPPPIVKAEPVVERDVPISAEWVGEVGNRATASGSVFDLKKLEDFSGNYVAGGVEGTVGGGAGATVMKNQNGVVIKLTSTTQGASLKLAASGVRLTLEK